MSGTVNRTPRPVAEINSEQHFLRSFCFPDAHIALTFFDNDLVAAPSGRVNIDDDYRTDDEDSIDDEASVPSRYLTTFEVELDSLPPSLTSSATLSSLDQAFLDQSGQQCGMREDRLFGLPEQGIPSRAPTPGLRRRSSAILDDDDDGWMSPLTLPAPIAKRCEGNNHHVPMISGPLRTYEILPREPPADPHLPAYIVDRADWQSAVSVEELAKQSPQHKQEVRALEWDTHFAFNPTHERDTVEYKAELADWRRRRFKCIYQEPTAQEKRRSDQILSRVAEIAEARAKRAPEKQIVNW